MKKEVSIPESQWPHKTNGFYYLLFCTISKAHASVTGNWCTSSLAWKIREELRSSTYSGHLQVSKLTHGVSNELNKSFFTCLLCVPFFIQFTFYFIYLWTSYTLLTSYRNILGLMFFGLALRTQAVDFHSSFFFFVRQNIAGRVFRFKCNNLTQAHGMSC